MCPRMGRTACPLPCRVPTRRCWRRPCAGCARIWRPGATYDSAKSTLTMSGVQLGREDNGNLLGKFTEALTPDKSRGYGIFSFAT